MTCWASHPPRLGSTPKPNLTLGNAEPSRPVLEALLVTGAVAGAVAGGTMVAVTGAVTAGACWSREPSREPSSPVDGAPLAPTLPPVPLRWALSLSTSESTGVPALACAELERANESAGVPALVRGRGRVS